MPDRRRHPWYVLVTGTVLAVVLLLASAPWFAEAAFRAYVLHDKDGAIRALDASPASRYAGYKTAAQ